MAPTRFALEGLRDAKRVSIQAVGLTFGTCFCLLAAYRSGMIRATRKFTIGIVAATGGICLVYLLNMVIGLFGIQVPGIFGSGPVGILFSLFVVVIAALNRSWISASSSKARSRGAEVHGVVCCIRADGDPGLAVPGDPAIV